MKWILYFGCLTDSLRMHLKKNCKRKEKETLQISHFTSPINMNNMPSFILIKTASQDANGKENGNKCLLHFLYVRKQTQTETFLFP